MSELSGQVKFHLRLSHGRYYNVLIFRRRAAMREYYRRFHSHQMGTSDFEAICMSWTGYRLRGGRWRRTKSNGTILFHSGFFGAGTVAHELTHAALHLAGNNRSQRPDFTSARREEAFCKLLGEMVRNFWRGYWRLEKTHAWLSNAA